MPPWGADPHYGKFNDDRSLTQQQIDIIAAWVDAGAPKGDDADLPRLPTFATGWSHGEPDAVIEMPIDFEIPAEGEVAVTDFFVQAPFKTDVYVKALEVRPGTAGVVHHAGLYVIDTLPDGATLVNGRVLDANGTIMSRNAVARANGGSATQEIQKLLSFVPGRGYEQYQGDAGQLIKAGSYIDFYMHYQPNGLPRTDRADGGEGGTGLPPIPPYVDNWKVVSVHTITEPITMYGLTPHLHLRGKSMTYVLTLPDGRDEVLLSVPKYDFNWQVYYELDTPKRIPAGSKVTVTTLFDNSPKNKYNPAPEKEVYWSEQSWDEMYAPQVRITIDSRDLRKKDVSTTQQPQKQR